MKIIKHKEFLQIILFHQTEEATQIFLNLKSFNQIYPF